ncbi:MAG: hypothetical protein HND48_13540 [Chloroflexi bacterium]|nr:hypothetical protein [Chloroflexota bacterium]
MRSGLFGTLKTTEPYPSWTTSAKSAAPLEKTAIGVSDWRGNEGCAGVSAMRT